MNNPDKRSTKIPLAEWVVACVGLLLVLATFGYLAQRALHEQSPPSFAARIESVVVSGDRFVANVIVHNNGGKPVAQLRVRADFAGREHANEAVIDYLPSHSKRRVDFIFTNRRDAENTTFEFVSYMEP